MRDPIVLERDVKGTVKWFSMMKGWLAEGGEAIKLQ
jgi:hypothetical protein